MREVVADVDRQAIELNMDAGYRFAELYHATVTRIRATYETGEA